MAKLHLIISNYYDIKVENLIYSLLQPSREIVKESKPHNDMIFTRKNTHPLITQLIGVSSSDYNRKLL